MQPYFNVLVFGTMAPHLTLTQYKHHYDNVHVPLVRNLTGANFPPLHTRYYVGGNPAFVNASAKVDWDSMAIMSFRDQAQAVGFMGVLGREEVAEVVRRDEEEFMAGEPRTVIVGVDVAVTVS
ncbi:hypothetical protein B5807_09622 [Epicoccum nigrum]|jgi:hypothetical protein|uniref:EthD domain-containing protein n=1 Tax=Epicoccum nigrum TaxID=105696 RepID=A0A1Y2LQ44_EPING|nr:hypothetical protein B5807_09622 [Epicoccum nigrum]